MAALRVGDRAHIKFPERVDGSHQAEHPTALAAPADVRGGCTNGYLYYRPTAEQLKNLGGPPKDAACLLAPWWQELHEDEVAGLLSCR